MYDSIIVLFVTFFDVFFQKKKATFVFCFNFEYFARQCFVLATMKLLNDHKMHYWIAELRWSKNQDSRAPGAGANQSKQDSKAALTICVLKIFYKS